MGLLFEELKFVSPDISWIQDTAKYKSILWILKYGL